MIDHVVLEYLNRVLSDILANVQRDRREMAEEFQDVLKPYIIEEEIPKLSLDLLLMFIEKVLEESSNDNSTVVENTKSEISVIKIPSSESYDSTPEFKLLLQLFPGIPAEDISRHFVACKGNLNMTVQAILDEEKPGTDIVLKLSGLGLDENLRKYILRNFSEVPDDENTFHKPFLRIDQSPIQSRWKNDTIVNNKLRKDNSLDEEHLKHTYINLKIITKGKRGPGIKKV